MKRLTKEEFIEKAKEVHGDKYDYSKVNYKNNKTKVEIICPKHGVFEITPHNILTGCGCPKCASGKKKQQNHNLTTEEFIKKANQIHNFKYNYLSEKETLKLSSKITIICPVHGEFNQTVHNHLQKHGCPICGFEASHKKISEEEIVKKLKEIHGIKYDYSKVIYNGYFKNIELICPKHGSFFKTPCNLLRRKEECPECGKNKYKGEEKIKDYLRKNNISYLRNFRIRELNFKSYDFFIPSKNLLIEYNGKQHYEPRCFGGISIEKAKKNLKKQRHHDWLKRKFAHDNNFIFLTIPYWEFNNIEAILEAAIYKN